MSIPATVSQSKQPVAIPTFLSVSTTLEKIQGLTLFSGGLGFIPVGLLALGGTINPLFILIPLCVQLSSAGFYLLAKQVFLKKCNQWIEETENRLSKDLDQQKREAKPLNETQIKAFKEIQEKISFLKHMSQEEVFNIPNGHQQLLNSLDALNTLCVTIQKTTPIILIPSAEESAADRVRKEALAHSEAALDRDILSAQPSAFCPKKRADLIQGFEQAVNRQKQNSIDTDDLIAQMNSVLSESNQNKRTHKAQTQRQADYEEARRKKDAAIRADLEAADRASTPRYQDYYNAMDVFTASSPNQAIPKKPTPTQPISTPTPQLVNNLSKEKRQPVRQFSSAPKVINTKVQPLSKAPPAQGFFSLLSDGASFIADVSKEFFSRKP